MMIFRKKIVCFLEKAIKTQKNCLKRGSSYIKHAGSKNLQNFTLIYRQKLYFSQNHYTVSILNFSKNYQSFEQITNQIHLLNQKLSQTAQQSQLEKIVYPQALLHGQQIVCKLTRLYERLMQYLENQNLEHKHFEHLIKAGDFYNKIHVRRLKALKQYLKAKYHMETQSLQRNQIYQKTYQQLCSKVGKMIKQDILQGEYQQVEHYYKQGLRHQKTGNQLQALYLYYKGLCISEYEKIPDKLLHFEILCHYTFLTEYMRPKCQTRRQSDHYQCCLQKYEQAQSIGKKWWKQEFEHHKDEQKKRKFKQTLIWFQANEGNLLFHARMYKEAIECYEKVADFYKAQGSIDLRIKIVNLIQNLQKCYVSVGEDKKALELLQWAHEAIKEQVEQSNLLKNRYLRPIDEMLISFYEQNFDNPEDIEKKKRLQIIRNQLRQIML